MTTSKPHRCPVKVCPNTRPPRHAMCSSCWHQVPEDLQRAVYRAYRERTLPGGMARHLQALEDALAAVEGREPQELFA